MFDIDRSAARGLMSPQRLIVFRHDSELGNAQANKLFDLVTIRRKDPAAVARNFSDYEVSVDTAALPNGVEILNML